jgi:hypothetical protein
MYTFSNYPVDYSGTVYFVSSSGNDSNDGLTSSTPWQTLDKINSMSYSAGDAILLDSSSSFIGSIAVPNSGSSEASITIGAYGTNISKPKIYGSELITDWTLHTGNI